jgi:type VI secretion system protein ImpH
LSQAASIAPALPEPAGAEFEFPRARRGVAEALFEEGYLFDFFQAVRLLERLQPSRQPVGRIARPSAEAVRFCALPAVVFPASAIYDISRPTADAPQPVMTVTFLGLFGPSGVLPRHYSELIVRQEREVRGPERYALRDWLDLFNHRLIALFYRAWEKYRFYIPFERGEFRKIDADTFTRSVFSLVGLGFPALRNRLRVAVPAPATPDGRENVLARIDDLSLLHYAGFFARRVRCAVSLEALLHDYFGIQVRLVQFVGQWLLIDRSEQTRLDAASALGQNAVAGERVWDVQGKVRVRLGPLSLERFQDFLPDRTPVPQRKAFFLLCHLVRLYIGPHLDFDVQLVLRAADVSSCRLGQGGPGACLGWNTWVACGTFTHDADDPILTCNPCVWLDGPPTP